MCRSKGYGIWAFLVWKRVYTLPILVWNRVWFSNYGSIIMKYLSFQFQMNKNDAFEEFFCLRSNPSNYDIISALRPGLKTGTDFRGLVWKRVRKMKPFGLK